MARRKQEEERADDAAWIPFNRREAQTNISSNFYFSNELQDCRVSAQSVFQGIILG